MFILWHIPPVLCDTQLSHLCNPETKELEVLRIVICINMGILFYRESSGNVQKDKEFAKAANSDRSGSKTLANLDTSDTNWFSYLHSSGILAVTGHHLRQSSHVSYTG